MVEGNLNTPPPPPEGFDHGTAKAVEHAKATELKEGKAAHGLMDDLRHEVVWVVTLPWRVVRGVVSVVKWPFKR